MSLLLTTALVLALPPAVGAAQVRTSGPDDAGVRTGASAAEAALNVVPTAAPSRAPVADDGVRGDDLGTPGTAGGVQGATGDAQAPRSSSDPELSEQVDVGRSSPRIDWLPLLARDEATCPAPTVTVDDADGLHAALAASGPGTVIGLEDGLYEGRFDITTSGRASEPAWLCGGPGAILDGGDTTKGYVLHLDQSDHWVVQGFGVRHGMKGVMADGVQGVTFRGLHVSDVGDEAIHLRRFSTDNLVVGNTVTRTGLREPKFGEGVYIGTATSNWCSISDCRPDRSDRNRVVGNWIHGTTAEAVDIKEGTSDGLVEGNRFDGAALTGADSWVDVKGNGWLVRDNHGEHTPRDGFQTHAVASGWGTSNHFEANSGLVDDDAGFLIALRPVLGNTLACDNELTGAVGGLSNVACR